MLVYLFFQLESFKSFDFNVWKQRYLNWIKVKKMRTTDFFRRQDKDGDGYLSRDEFVNGMLHSGKCNSIHSQSFVCLFVILELPTITV